MGLGDCPDCWDRHCSCPDKPISIEYWKKKLRDACVAWSTGRLCECGEYTYEFECHDCGRCYDDE